MLHVRGHNCTSDIHRVIFLEWVVQIMGWGDFPYDYPWQYFDQFKPWGYDSRPPEIHGGGI